MDNGTDIWLKQDGTNAQAKQALQTLNITEFMARDKDGKLTFGDVFTPDFILKFHMDLMTVRAVFDNSDPPIQITPPVFEGPHLQIRLLSNAAIHKARNIFFEVNRDQDGNLVRKTLPAGIAFAETPTTTVWF